MRAASTGRRLGGGAGRLRGAAVRVPHWGRAPAGADSWPDQHSPVRIGSQRWPAGARPISACPTHQSAIGTGRREMKPPSATARQPRVGGVGRPTGPRRSPPAAPLMVSRGAWGGEARRPDAPMQIRRLAPKVALAAQTRAGAYGASVNRPEPARAGFRRPGLRRGRAGVQGTGKRAGRPGPAAEGKEDGERVAAPAPFIDSFPKAFEKTRCCA